jgi:hypothetical protein
MDGSQRRRAGEGLRPELEDEPDKVVPPISERRKKRRYPFRRRKMGRGPDLVLGWIWSPSLFTLFLFLLFFPFLFYLFFYIIFKIASNEPKHNPKIF